MIPLPWSYSTLATFDSCPKKFYELKVAKSVKESDNPMSIWGNRVHKAFELHLRDGEPLPEEMKNFQGYMDAVKSLGGEMLVEQKLAIDKAKQPAEFFESPWARGVIDVLVIKDDKAIVIDHKLGKIKPSTQLALNALMVFSHYPHVEQVRTVFSWLQFDQTTTGVYRREDIAGMWGEFEGAVVPYDTAFRLDVWPTRPSGLCNGWCPVESCTHWRPKRK